MVGGCVSQGVPDSNGNVVKELEVGQEESSEDET